MLRAVLKDGGVYTIANVLTKGFSFLLLPFYTHYFEKSAVGVIDMLAVFGLFVSSIVCFQLNQGMGRYVADPEKTEDDRIRYASTAILFTSLMYAIFATLIIIAGNIFIDLLSAGVKIPKDTFNYAVVGISATGLVYFIGVYLRFIRKTKAFAITSFAHGFLTTGLIFLLVLEFDLGINGVYIAPILSSPIIIFSQLIIVRKELILKIEGSKLKELFIYSLPLIPAAAAHVVLNFTDRLFIKEYLTFDDLGVYSIGFKFSIIIQVVILGISSALGPIAFELSQNKNVKAQLARVFRLFIVFGSLGVLVLSLFSFETLWVFTNPDYYEAQYLMPVFYLSTFFGGFSMFSIGLQIEKKTRLIGTVVVISSLLNIGLNFLLISKFEMIGAALATLLSVSMNNITLFLVSQKHYPLNFQYAKVFLLLMMLGLLIFGGNYILPEAEFPALWNIIIKTILIITFAVYLRISKLVNFKQIRLNQK